MKQILIAIVAVFLLGSLAFAQTHAGGGSGSLAGSNTPGLSGMIGGAHDFTSSTLDSANHLAYTGGSDNLCGYCHTPHVSSSGINVPLWARKSITKKTLNGAPYGTYTSTNMDATPTEVSFDDNYSSFCMSCHDGSMMFAASAYQSLPVPHGVTWPTNGQPLDTTTAVPSWANMSTVGGSYGGLSHVHPVNFAYNSTLAIADPGLYTPVNTNYAAWDPSYGPVGRLFAGKMQCSSCHNPHNNKGVNTDYTYPLLQGTLQNGALCTACHKK